MVLSIQEELTETPGLRILKMGREEGEEGMDA